VKIQLNAMPFSPSGYGELTRYYMRVLHDAGHDVRAHQPWEYCDAASPQFFGQQWCEVIEDLVGRHAQPDVVVDFGFPEMLKVKAIDRRVGLTMYETDPLPRAYADACNKMDAVIIPGPWGKNLFERSGVTVPVRVVPPGIYEVPPVAVRDADGAFKFLSVFSWQEARKNPLALLTAFLLEFGRHEYVELVLRTADTARAWVGDLKGKFGKNNYPVVRVESEVLSTAMLGNLYDQACCVVSASCAEGFCMPLLEAQARGLPVITTAYSEPTSFVTEQTGYLVGWERAEAVGMKKYMPEQPGYYDSSMTWASIDVDDLRAAMRRAYDNQDEARAKGAAGRLNVIENFSPKAAAAAFQKIFEERL
jgi:glycosyltransferase involved in cell wall biosynthesis